MRKLIIVSIFLSSNYFVFSQGLAPGTIGSDQIVCYGSPAKPLTQIPASGGTIPYRYQWQRSNDNGITWINIYRAANVTYQLPILVKTAMFRRRVIDAANITLYTDSVTITVTATLNAGTIGNVSSGSAPNDLDELTPANGGAGNYTYRWQISNDGYYWSDIQGAVSSGYAPVALTSDTWFRRWVVDSGCGSVSSNSVKITVNPITLYDSEQPNSSNYYMRFDLGTEFKVLVSGFISKVRLYTHNNEGGIHQIRLWRRNDQSVFELVSGPIEWNLTEGFTGWRELQLPVALAVEANRNYIVSITSGVDNNWWVQGADAVHNTTNPFLSYIRGLLTANIGSVPDEPKGFGYFRDIVFVPFSPGIAGLSQSICYNSAPNNLEQISPPTGGAGNYTFQWQNSTDSITWTNIQGATSSEFTPTFLTSNTYFRRAVSSDGLTGYCPPVLITVDPQFSLAQLHDNISIYENSSTFFNVILSGGTPPYAINYSCNGVPQSQISNYISGTEVLTGVLGSGTYVYSLTSITDAMGCSPQSLGENIAINASGNYEGAGSNKALVIVNSGSLQYFSNFADYIQPYLEWFGIPYEIYNVSTGNLPDFNNYSLIIFGHKNVYESDYPISALQNAVYSGVGLCSFDPHLFDFSSSFNIYESTAHPTVVSGQIAINTNHYITQLHINDTHNPTNNIVNLRYYNNEQQTITINQSYYTLVDGLTLASVSQGSNTEAILQVTTYGNGKVVKWSSYDWMYESKLGPVYGMDDLIWRGIVWSARKPFVMQGIPPMITMRVDDVDGYGTELEMDLKWLKISNEYGFKPWCGTFIDSQSGTFYSTLRTLINDSLTTASPHAFSVEGYIYYNGNNLPVFDAAANVREARQVYIDNAINMSKYFVPHAYLLSSDALAEINNMGIQFIGTTIPYDPAEYPGPWLSCGPYRNHRSGWAGGYLPIFNAGIVNWPGINLFVWVTEIRDDGDYEWFPTNDVAATTARGVRHLRRALNSMVLPNLFTHESQIVLTESNWRQILSGICTAVSLYNPEYISVDNALRYLRAKGNISISNVTLDNSLITLTCTGNNDRETKCYLFTESSGQISSRLITLPRITGGSITVGIIE
ncbi:MAG: DUF4082 domain-containing protein [Bacteroidales bacterium]